MRASVLRIGSIALAAALAASACGGSDETTAAAPAPVATQKARPKPARIESTPEPPTPPVPAKPPAPPPPLEPESEMPSYSPDVPLAEGEEQIRDLPDVPIPAGARALSPLLMSKDGIAHGTYEIPGSAASAATSYTAGLLQKGWSIEPAKTSGSQALINATKGDRQLSIAIDGSGERSQIVIIEMQRPPG